MVKIDKAEDIYFNLQQYFIIMKNFPKKSWEWGHDEYRYHGVQTYEGCLLWYTQTKQYWAGGGARKQSFDDFIENGPFLNNVPNEILDEIYDLLDVPTEERIYK